MLTQQDLLWALVIPFGISLVLMALFGGWRWGAALALGGAFSAAHIGLFIWPGLPSGEGWPSTDALLALVRNEPAGGALIWGLAATLIGMLIACTRVSEGAAWLGRIMLAAGVVNTVLWPVIDSPHWDRLEALVHVQATIAIMLVAWWSLDELTERQPGPVMPMILTVTALGAAALALVGGSRPLLVNFMMITAAVAGGLIVAMVRRSMTWSRGGVAVYVCVMTALLLCAIHFYADGLPPWIALTIGLTPLVGWLGTVRPLASMRSGARTFLLLILVLIAVGVAVAPGVMRVARSVQPPQEAPVAPAP